MSCSKHDGCDYGCGACNWDEAVTFTKAQLLLKLVTKVSELKAQGDDRWNGYADAVLLLQKGDDDE